MNYEEIRIWKEAVVDSLKVPSLYSPGETG